MDGVVSVTGVGAASAPPDVVCLDLAAECQAPAAHEALAAAGLALRRMRAALLEHGVAETDLTSENIALDTQYSQPGRPGGYQATYSLSALLRDLASAGSALELAVRAGGDAARVRRMSLAHSDPQTLREQARTAAWADARAKAQRYAELAGGTLGDATAIEEVGDARPGSPRFAKMTFLAATPVDPGSLGVEVSVNVTFRLR